jgi:biopolymer transport protein ExbD
MQFRHVRATEDDDPDLNLIPLIDVLLMTLIFLIVTTSFAREARLSVRLPEASAATKDDRPSLRVSVDAKGQYFINDQQLLNTSPDTLRSAMSRAAVRMKDPLIVIHADGKAPHESVVRVMDSARRLGLTNLTFATQQPAGAAAP